VILPFFALSTASEALELEQLMADWSNVSGNRFMARDTGYFRHDQYASTENLEARILLHAKYGTSDVDWFDWLHANIDWTAAHHVLEVGCGTGLFWSALPNGVNDHLRPTLTDLSSGMVDAAVVRARSTLQYISGVTVDVQTLPFGGATFDLVIANHMLYHVPDPRRALTEIQRVLQPGGILIASTVGPKHLRELFEIEARVFGVTPTERQADVFGRVSGQSLLEQYFSDVTWRQFDEALRCTDVDDVIGHLTSTPPSEDATPEELVRLRVETGQRMLDGGGSLYVTKDCGLFRAERAFST